MVLVFGGTTEGRKAVEVLEEAGSPYYYSTKTGEQDIVLKHGIRHDGALNGEAMQMFCQEHGICLIVDAAHPFASQLHQTIAQVSEAMNIPVVRYERIYPPRDPNITWIDDYSQIPTDFHSLLATTGVQSIRKLKPLEAAGVKICYRILNRASSIAQAHQQGATDDQLCFFEDGAPVVGEASKLCSRLSVVGEASKLCDVVGFTYYDAILLKESGLSGGFQRKVEAAKAQGMRIIALKRPAMPQSFVTVNGPHGLRRAVEHLLPEFYPLHSGLTTGTCATAAVVAEMLRSRQRLEALQEDKNPQSLEASPTTLPQSLEASPTTVPVILPNGETIDVPVGYGDGYAYCIKEAGDDPDATNGIEVRASLTTSYSPKGKGSIEILGGEGVGVFTLPGFDYPPGSPAINKAPREMIRQNIMAVVGEAHYTVTISVPGGAEIARRTFNPRLGIEGGISIIGVSGIVKPFSEEAFIDSIRKCMTVAKASGSERVVINSGGKSERFVKALYPTLPQQAFVEYGNYIGETLKIANELNFKNVTLGVMLGKAVKLAAGHLDTHSRKTTMDKTFIQQILEESGCDIDISNITLARELWDRLPSDKLSTFADTIIRHCAHHCTPLLPNATLTLLLIDERGKIYPQT